MRGYVEAGVAEKVRAAGGEIYAISSEPQALAGRATPEWELDFQTVGDPHQEIASSCRERGWLDLYVNEAGLEFLEQSASAHADFEVTHPKGYFQPGVLAVASDGRVLYRWRSIPTHQNLGGALERPTAAYAWRNVQRALDDPRPVDAPLDAAPELDSRGVPWPIFVSLLIANGWFLRGRGFRSPGHIPIAALRLLCFAAASVGALAWLPTLPVAIGLAGWAAYIVPQVRWLGRQFQDASA